jgi:hypothetical protein
MWKLFFVLALPLAPVATIYGGAPEGLVQAHASAEVECEIRTKTTTGGVELEGVVASGTPISGTYEFDVRKSGSAGTSNSAQSGDFEMQTGEEVIGYVGLSLERGASYKAKLVVQWPGGETTCLASGPDEA